METRSRNTPHATIPDTMCIDGIIEASFAYAAMAISVTAKPWKNVDLSIQYYDRTALLEPTTYSGTVCPAAGLSHAAAEILVSLCLVPYLLDRRPMQSRRHCRPWIA